MRGWTVVAAGLLAGVCGCLPFRAGPPARLNPFAPAPPPADRVTLRTVLLDRPAGDPFLSRELWSAALRPLPPEQAALLAENGFRVGTFAGPPPPGLLALMTDESAVRPTASTVPAGEPKVIPVNGPLPAARFGYRPTVGADPHPFDLTAAECGLAVTTTPAADGKWKVHIEPRVQHGERQNWLRPAADEIGLAWLDGKAGERFGPLAFELPLAADETLVVGPSEVPGGKLGGAFFVPAMDARVRMRVLVLRAGGPAPAVVPAGRRPAPAAQAGGR